MQGDTADPFKDRAVKAWLAVQIVGIVAWVAVIAALTLAGADFLLVAIAAFVLAFAAGFAFDPRRPWWGAGPMAVMADPASRRRYRRVMTIWLLAVVGLMFVAPLVLVAAGILSPGTA